MLQKILMPSGGQTTDELTLLKWNKHVGDFVKRGDILFEVETDKAVLTVESYAEGILLDALFTEGALVKTGEIVAYIGNEGDLPANYKTGKKSEDGKTHGVQQVTTGVAQMHLVDEPGGKNGSSIMASPLARNLARIENVSLEDVRRTTGDRPIKKADVNEFINKRRAHADAASPGADHYTIELTPIRRAIARRMSESVSVAPHYVVSIDVDMTASILLRAKINSRNNYPAKVTFNDIMMKVIAKAVERVPLVNGRFEEATIKVFRDVNIGLAVATDRGIIVPVVHKANNKSLSEIAVINASNISKVKSGSLAEADLQAGTITISNLGMFGVTSFSAIINQPESCILAVGGIMKKAVVVGDELGIRSMMNITASFDHRLIDGAAGATFLQKVKELLEEPELLSY